MGRHAGVSLRRLPGLACHQQPRASSAGGRVSAPALSGRDRRFFDRPLHLAAPVRWQMHLAAFWAAGGDGRHGVLSAVDPDRMDPLYTTPGAPSDIETFWIARNREGFLQADERDLRAMAARVAPWSRELASLVDQRSLLVAERAGLVGERERLEARPRPELSTIQRGPAETSAHDGVVLDRRTRTWTAPIDAVAARIVTIDSTMRDIDTEAAKLAGALDTAFAIELTRSRALRHHYERCAETYRRRLTHRHRDGAAFQAAAMATITIPVPEWNTASNPWIPAGYRRPDAVTSSSVPTRISTEETSTRV